MKYIITLLIASAVALQAAPKESKISVETLAAIRSIDVTEGQRYGAGLGVGYKLNSYVTGRARVLAYHDWRGGTIDEGSLLVEAGLFRSANKAFCIAAIGGLDYDFEAEDIGFSAGLRASFDLTPRLGLVAESRIRHWFASEPTADLISTAGLSFSF